MLSKMAGHAEFGLKHGHPMMAAGQPVSKHCDVFANLLADHHHYKNLLHAYEEERRTANNPERLTQIRNALIKDVSGHTGETISVLYACIDPNKTLSLSCLSASWILRK